MNFINEGQKVFEVKRVFEEQKDIQEPGVLTWKKFAKDLFDGSQKPFSFGKWFYDVMILTRNYLSGEWKAGLIAGFMSKNEAKEKLQNCQIGTFLLRFSDSASGKLYLRIEFFLPDK